MMRFITAKMLTEHKKECSLGPSTCDQCYWQDKGPRWRRRLLIPGLQKTWLACCQKKVSDSSVLRLGCVVCQRLMSDDPTAGGDQFGAFKVKMEELPKHFCNFKRHMSSERHVKGLLQWQLTRWCGLLPQTNFSSAWRTCERVVRQGEEEDAQTRRCS